MALRDAVLLSLAVPEAPAPPEVATPAEVVEQQTALGRTQSIWTPLADACEDAVLAACTQDAEYAQLAAGILQADDFDLAWRQRVWSAVVALLDRGLAPDLVALLAKIDARDYDRLQSALYHSPNAYAFDALGTVKMGGDYRRALLLAQEEVRE